MNEMGTRTKKLLEQIDDAIRVMYCWYITARKVTTRETDKTQSCEKGQFDGVNPAVRMQAVLGCHPLSSGGQMPGQFVFWFSPAMNQLPIQMANSPKEE